MIGERGDLSSVAAPALGGLGPAGLDFLFLPVAHLHGEAAVAVDHEAGAVEHQFVLPADAVEVGQRQPGIDRAALGHAIDAQRVLVDLVGAAVDADEHLGPEIGEVAADVGLPDVLADRHSDHGPAHDDRFGQRAGLEQPHLVERAVVGQLVLEARRGDLALI
jgi:hypothetical protein